MKKCNICQNAEASIVITTIDKDGQVLELALCQDCATKKGVGEIKKVKLDASEILSELQNKITVEDNDVICLSCGLSYADFRRHGRLGCESCYQYLGEKLQPVIKRIHGTTRHTGKTTTPGSKKIASRFEIRKLRLRLQQAINKEEFEKAAQIRDQIKKVRQQNKIAQPK